MNKSIVAALIALFMTACIGAAILLIGGAAVVNQNSVPAADSPTLAAGGAGQTDQVIQLQNLVSQYQDREQQLRDQLSQANSQIQTDQEMIQQAQLLVQALQQRGLIRITNDGRILLNQ